VVARADVDGDLIGERRGGPVVARSRVGAERRLTQARDAGLDSREELGDLRHPHGRVLSGRDVRRLSRPDVG
jgi:hypothetical protein